LILTGLEAEADSQNGSSIKKMLKFDITRQLKHNYTNVIRKKNYI